MSNSDQFDTCYDCGDEKLKIDGFYWTLEEGDAEEGKEVFICNDCNELTI